MLDGIPSTADCIGTTAVGLCLGEDDMAVVAAVVAVFGLSEVVIAAADDDGSLPVNSSFLILDFRSSSSSHTVEGAVVEMVDSVALCSGTRGRSRKAPPSDTKRELRAVLGRVTGRAGSALGFVVEFAAENRLAIALLGKSAGWELWVSRPICGIVVSCVFDRDSTLGTCCPIEERLRR